MNTHEKLRDIRIDHDHRQKDTAEVIKCSAKQVMRYEAGEQEMTLSKLRDFCLYYQVSADYILGLPKGMKWPR